jgi:hypothetical protein
VPAPITPTISIIAKTFSASPNHQRRFSSSIEGVPIPSGMRGNDCYLPFLAIAAPERDFYAVKNRMETR